MDYKSEYFDIIREEKIYLVDQFKFPNKNEYAMLDVIGQENREYIVDVNRKSASLKRCTFQERFSTKTILLRLDIDTKPHRNPGSKKQISGNHIHIYTDEYGDSFALELDDPELKQLNPNFDLRKFKISDNANRFYELFEAFSEFCNISNIPSYSINFLDEI